MLQSSPTQNWLPPLQAAATASAGTAATASSGELLPQPLHAADGCLLSRKVSQQARSNPVKAAYVLQAAMPAEPLCTVPSQSVFESSNLHQQLKSVAKLPCTVT